MKLSVCKGRRKTSPEIPVSLKGSGHHPCSVGTSCHPPDSHQWLKVLLGPKASPRTRLIENEANQQEKNLLFSGFSNFLFCLSIQLSQPTQGVLVSLKVAVYCTSRYCVTSVYRGTANLLSKNKMFCGVRTAFGMCLHAVLNWGQRGPGCSSVALNE